jgi:hypothetical protein
MWHGYVGFQDLNLTSAQRQTLWDAFRSLPPALVTDQPKHLNQFRISLDNTKAICELLFDDDAITIAGIRQRLANLFGVQAGNIGVDQQSIELGWSHSPVWTFIYGGTAYLRVVVFGGIGADWLQSRDAALDYVRRNLEEWQDES